MNLRERIQAFLTKTHLASLTELEGEARVLLVQAFAQLGTSEVPTRGVEPQIESGREETVSPEGVVE